MTFTEKITDPRDVKHRVGHMETDYLYTAGIAGDRFFKELKENAKIFGAKCGKCGIVYVPPRIYCERCFERLEEWLEVGSTGSVFTYTTAHVDEKGSRLEKPTIWAFVKIDGTDGGFVHKLREVDLKDVKIGMRVKAVLKAKEKREGSVLDIEYFKPYK